jgi:hypothetical protein
MYVEPDTHEEMHTNPASSFYRDSNGNPSLREYGFSIEWAERAGKLAYQDVETPNQDNLVTFLNLLLFWYGQGSWRRSFVHKGMNHFTFLVSVLLLNAVFYQLMPFKLRTYWVWARKEEARKNYSNRNSAVDDSGHAFLSIVMLPTQPSASSQQRTWKTYLCHGMGRTSKRVA